MCGFLGIASTDDIKEKNLLLENKRIICRGPDETQQLESKSSDLNLDLIFNRLSILELSPSGSQPIVDSNNNYVMMFNGEIFNYIELKKYLSKYNIQYESKNSDSEVLFYGLIKEGSSFLDKLIGQFSIVFIDKRKSEIILARDRTGQKPLFYFCNNKSLYFGSNVISVSNMSNAKEINKQGLKEFLNLGVITSPDTIYKNVFKVKPGEYITFSYSDTFTKESDIYWDPSNYLEEKDAYNNTDFDNLISDSIVKRLRSDVPVATFCSGGLDSTLIIKKLNELGIKAPTFSVINKNPKYDERKYIDKVIEKYKNQSTTREIDSKVTFEQILHNIVNFDEPYMDASSQPSTFISKAISENYKVAISGDGGDEIFYGYQRFQNEFKVKKIPSFLANIIYRIYPAWLGTGNKILKHNKDYKVSYPSYFEDNKFMHLLGFNYKSEFSEKFLENTENKVKNLMILENKFYLSEMMNLKVDRTSMANSLEVRSPFIDHRLIEYLLSRRTDSLEYKKPKLYVKQYLSQDFDENFLNRKKMGFVFDLENLIYENKEKITTLINESGLHQFIPKLNTKKLFIRKSRINSQRIYKLLILTHFIKNN